MVERIKNKKGFTIIEIMVVIALIGILAAVLVPKFGGVRDTAKNTGMLTNAKMVEAYVASVIDSYKVGEDAALVTAITNQFKGTGNQLANPYTGVEADTNISVTSAAAGTYSAGAADATDAGIVYVVVNSDNLKVFINGFDSKGSELKNTKREITR